VNLQSLHSPEQRESRDALALLSRAEYVLFDFDGPICKLFARYPAARIARQLKRACRADGVSLPKELARSSDPHGILWRLAGELPADQSLARKAIGIAESTLAAGELRAARSAERTPGAVKLMHALHRQGRTLAIVSNNSSDAIDQYLRAHGLTSLFGEHVYGRLPEPEFMKPHPNCLLRAVGALEARPEQCVMIGDSRADVQAAAAMKEATGAPVGFIGYARNKRKARVLREAGARALAGSMAELLGVFEA
jgi:HAD superfamily hydrolase (TIGR01509 family)